MAKNAVQRAVKMCGGPTRVSLLTGFSGSAIHWWMRDNRIPDSRAAIILSEVTGIPIRQLAGMKDPPLARIRPSAA